ncbi:MAG: carbonic anhydrase family protein [Myxococcales bacterium]|nr:carbonic anhydrase family protein [Myxococcales bacterium]
MAERHCPKLARRRRASGTSAPPAAHGGKAKEKEKEKENITVERSQLLPVEKDKFWHYEGSLTTPDFDEVVSWAVVRDAVTLDSVSAFSQGCVRTACRRPCLSCSLSSTRCSRSTRWCSPCRRRRRAAGLRARSRRRRPAGAPRGRGRAPCRRAGATRTPRSRGAGGRRRGARGGGARRSRGRPCR